MLSLRNASNLKIMSLASVTDHEKTFKSALCIITPKESWDPIQAIRRKHDKNFSRWMPHINVLYPFRADTGENFEAAAATCLESLSSFSPFLVDLSTFDFFEHKKSCTLWLNPKKSVDELSELQSKLEMQFPECNDLSSVLSNSYKPHLSVGQWENRGHVESALKTLSESWEPITFEVHSIYLISRSNFHDPFHIRFQVPFGGKNTVMKRVDIPYRSKDFVDMKEE